MKQVITFEIYGERASGPILLHIVIVLHQLRLNPLAISWARDEKAGVVGVGRLVLSGHTNYYELLEALRATEGLRKVVTEFATLQSTPTSE